MRFIGTFSPETLYNRNRLDPLPETEGTHELYNPDVRVYCGPFAVSAITGISGHDAVAEFQKLRNNNRRVVTTTLTEIESVLKELGYDTTYHTVRYDQRFSWKRRFFETDDQFTELLCTHRSIIRVGRHFVACNGSRWVDITTRPGSKPITCPRISRKRITHALILR